MLWILASTLFIISSVLFAFLIWNRMPAIQAGSLTLGDLINLSTVLLTMIGLAVAFGSLYIAIATYQKAVADSIEQKQSLDASKAQLQAVVDSLKGQQEVLTKNLETSKSLLTIQREQQEVLSESFKVSKSVLALQKEERERIQDLANRKPKILAILGNQLITESKVEATIPFDKETNRAILPLFIKNIGSASVQTAHFTVFSRNREVTLWFESTYSDVRRPFRSQIEWKSLLSFQGSQTTYNSNIYISAPNTISEVDLSFSVTAENLDSPFLIDFRIHLDRGYGR